MTPTCPPVPETCAIGGRTWLRDDATGACCDHPCWTSFEPGFTAFRDAVTCQALPECNGHALGDVVPSGDGCNECTCTTNGRWSCTENSCDGTAAGKTCGYWQGGCPSGEYCAFVPDDSCSDGDAPSVCRAVPVSCSDVVAPVCGCNARDYANRCEAAKAGTGIRHVGACLRRGPCTSNDDCGNAEFCMTRQCTPRPRACINQLAPVCGKNGVTYGNACLAAKAGVEVRASGECKSACTGAADCAGDEYCSSCTGGQCLPRPREPISCMTLQEVCGCDGERLGCPEIAPYLGTSVRSNAPCP